MATFKTDEQGNVILKPIMGWELRHIAGMMMVVAIEYSDSQEDLERGLNQTIAFTIQPAMAITFAESLKREATELLVSGPTKTSIQ